MKQFVTFNFRWVCKCVEFYLCNCVNAFNCLVWLFFLCVISVISWQIRKNCPLICWLIFSFPIFLFVCFFFCSCRWNFFYLTNYSVRERSTIECTTRNDIVWFDWWDFNRNCLSLLANAMGCVYRCFCLKWIEKKTHNNSHTKNTKALQKCAGFRCEFLASNKATMAVDNN